MSVLTRYRKPGGFVQLLKLIETSQPVKQAKLLEVVEKEDPIWANKIREKKLSPEMVLSWPPEHLITILEHMSTRHCACLLKSLGTEHSKQYISFFKGETYRDVKNLVDDNSEPPAGEIVAAQNNLLETVRFLDEEKKINLRFINPNLDLSEAV